MHGKHNPSSKTYELCLQRLRFCSLASHLGVVRLLEHTRVVVGNTFRLSPPPWFSTCYGSSLLFVGVAQPQHHEKM
jgi:hypothetical protein